MTVKAVFAKLKRFTWRKLFHKIGQMIRGIPNRISFKKVHPVNDDLYAALPGLAARIPDPEQGSYYGRSDLRVGIITDEFMYNYYKDALHLVALTPENYATELRGGLDAVLYVSGWHGLHGEWQGAESIPAIAEVFRAAREQGIPTLFQTIEDPSNYARYLPIAKEATAIFTTDSDKIENYKADTGNDKVFTLKYGVNPTFHSPIGCRKKLALADEYDRGTVFFAGSWTDRYKNRCRDTALLFDGVLAAGRNLLVADRNIHVKMPGYRFPARFRDYVEGPIDHALLQKVHKLFDFAVNVNSIQNSPTMCAMRVYELQAQGCLMLSNYSLAVCESFPGMFMVNNKEEVAELLNGYDEEQLYRMSVEGIRNVMTDATVFDRLNEIFSGAGIARCFPRKKVTVLCKERTPAIEAAFAAQTYPEKTLMTEVEYAAMPAGDYVAQFDEYRDYGENYLQDLVNAYKYTSASVVTKDAAAPADDYDFFDASAFTPDPALSITDPTRPSGRGFKLDPFGVDEKKVTTGTPEKEIAVIVPVYNNGKYLLGRCIRSLRRSSVFPKMRLYLVDDGSTDGETPAILRKLAARYDNIETYFFEDGGSGSASRPRNKGAELSSEPYITYLDPDNEALSDGYAKLYAKLTADPAADMVFGSILTRRDADRLVHMGYFTGDREIDDPRATLLKEKFRSQSIQACLIRRELITENGIENPVGAVGQDTLFFHELMLNAKKVVYLDLPIHLYYAQRAGSETNKVGASFFHKSLLTEQALAERFARYGVLEDYKRTKLDYFVENWYLLKLKNCKPEEREESLGILSEILSLYGKTLADYGVKE